ncbi:MAG: TMEM175 family protein [Pseudolysinimonas sp.]
MTSIRDRYRAMFGHGRETERIIFFSDAVFAIALTLLVIDLRVPVEDHGETSGDVIVTLLPGFLAYFISFVVIAVNWLRHHRTFQVIKEYDSRLLQLNFVLLFLIALLPFPTSLMSEYAGEVPSVVLYAAMVALLNLAQLAMWSYAYRRGLMDKTIDEPMYRYVRRSLLIVPIVFAISILIAIFWDPTIAMFSWIALWPISEIVPRLAFRKRAQAVTSKVDTESSAPGTSE